MTLDQTFLFLLFGAVFAALIWGRWRYDAVAFAALIAGVLSGAVPAEKAFEGFGHPATVIVALVLVVSAGLSRAGAVALITRHIGGGGNGLGRHIAAFGAVGAALSAFMNNVAALALLMQVDMARARQEGRPPGLTLMPLSFATILGGMVTLIGTPPNIIVASVRKDMLGESYSMFDFAPVGGAVALAGLLFVATVGWRLIPNRPDPAPAGERAAYLAEFLIPDASPLAEATAATLFDEADKSGVAIVALRRGRRRMAIGRETTLQTGDAIEVEADAEQLDGLRTALKLDFADPAHKDYLSVEKAGMAVIEAVVPATARMAGRTSEAVGLGWRQRSALLGVSRQGRNVSGPVRKVTIKPGDILLLLAPADRAAEVVDWLGCLPLADRGLTVTRSDRAWLATGLFALAVAAASLGLVTLPVALGAVVLAFLVSRILPPAEVYEHVEWPVVVLLGSMIPLGAALETSGGTALIASALTGITAGAPAWVALMVLMVVTMTLSDVLNNTATALVAAPVGVEMARSLQVSPDPFLMAVAVAASCAFLTPIGHKNNLLILGPGGYRFGDYWRAGLPLELIVIAVGLPVILFVWPL
ncbi:MAG: SLC13 family permease [Paracoccaceae bacterium]